MDHKSGPGPATLTLKIGAGTYTFLPLTLADIEALSPLLLGFLELSFSGHIWPTGLRQIDPAYHSMWKKILERVNPLLAETPADCAEFWPRHAELLIAFWREHLYGRGSVS